MKNSIRLIFGMAGLSLLSVALPVSLQNGKPVPLAVALAPYESSIAGASFSNSVASSLGKRFDPTKNMIYAVATGISVTAVLGFGFDKSNRSTTFIHSEDMIMKQNMTFRDSLPSSPHAGACSGQRNRLSDFETLLLVQALSAQAAQDESTRLAFDERLILLQAEMTTEMASREVAQMLIGAFDSDSPGAAHFYEAFARWSENERGSQRGEA